MNASAGWYDDGSGRRRWWDGMAWTDRYEQQAPPPPPVPGTAYHPKMDTPELQPKQNRGMILGCLGCITIPIAVAIVFMIIGAVKGGGEYDSNNKYEAIAQCEARVKDLLKAPSTAKFSSDATGSGTWTVTGTVDAENSFGAMIRSTYGCTVTINGDTATTTVDYFG